MTDSLAPSHRLAGPADRAFIVDSWVESYRHAHAAGAIPMPHYQRVYRDAANWFLDQPGCVATVAELDGMLAGFIAAQTDAQVMAHQRKRVGGRLQWVDELAPAGCPFVLYLYVKDAFRHHGIGLALMAAAGARPDSRFLYMSKTPMGDRFLKKHGFAYGSWRPLDARFPKTQPLEK
jgi:GNAT superfamily N-acetyltransferase